jgi:hypothetical protein
MTITLFRSGVAFATCFLKFDGVKTKSGNSTAEYKLEIKRSEGRLRSKKGLCDIDLSTTEIQRGLPAILKGDTVVLEEAAAGVFMDGSF